MVEPHEDLERELRSLPPLAPAADLLQRLERDLSAPAGAKPRYRSATTLNSWKWAGWQIAAAAAAVAIAGTAAVMRLVLPPPAPEAAPALVANRPAPMPQVVSSTPAGADLYRPVKATNVLYDTADEGLVTLESDLAARRTRYRYVDTITWKNQSGNATVRWSIPREEVRFVPVVQN